MKISLCSTGFKDHSVENVLKLAYQLGLDGVELWTGHIEEYLERSNSLQNLNSLVRSYNLSIPAISPYTYFSKSEEEVIDSVTEIKRYTDIAFQLNCPLVRTFVGHYPSKEVSDEQWKRTIDHLKQAIQEVDQDDVNVGVEIHNNTFADTIESITKIVSEVNHPRLSLIFDGFNLYVDRLEQMEAFHTLHPFIQHVHLKNYRWNHEDWDQSIPTSIFGGDVDHKQLLNQLREKGYQNFISLEYFGHNAEKCIRESIKELQDIKIRN
ncbi:sugar phosphate isomerase/epimerase family protein [Neobacillus niacini]|uniref:sugar phosphate isomerase/epimerase family protein n=1 Tax=Neobacillus niacini TaxID=86668 RepID=UPI00398300C2